jgi:aryl-alcohol dehydrogenase-like predicted oxidoreductase
MNLETRQIRRPLGSTGLSCHPLGFGCYRIADGNAEHAAALREYLDRGGNLIDTSANYSDGQSEILVGRVLKRYPKDQIVVVTKAGYIQGQNMALARSHSFPEVVKYAEGIWHCIHPEFLDVQITLSSQRLELDVIDILLLHNPEYFLSHLAYQNSMDAAGHEEFYRRIGQAFRFLEDTVHQNRIRWYGISSNNYGLPASDPTMTSVARCLAAAEEISADHHFRVVQLPVNLYESGGALEQNNQGETVLDFCSRNELGVLVNRPLNAFFKNQLIRLADFAQPGTSSPGRENLTQLLEPLREHEKALPGDILIPVIGGRRQSLASALEQIVPQLESVDHWEQMVTVHIIGPLQSWIQENGKKLGNNMAWTAWLEQFFPILHATFEQIEGFVRAQHQSISDEIRQALAHAGYSENSSTLSQIALRVLLDLPGVSCVLNGMRRRTYVQDSFKSLELPEIDSVSLLKKFRSHIQ